MTSSYDSPCTTEIPSLTSIRYINEQMRRASHTSHIILAVIAKAFEVCRTFCPAMFDYCRTSVGNIDRYSGKKTFQRIFSSKKSNKVVTRLIDFIYLTKWEAI